MDYRQYASLEEYAAARKEAVRQKRSFAKQGEKGPTAVLTADQVRELRAIYEPGKRGTGSKALVTYLQQKYGITMHYRSIDQILKRETWKHI